MAVAHLNIHQVLDSDNSVSQNETQYRSFGADPIQSTFRGGKSEPLHLWYPYLEGYSPEFVREIIETYMPNSTQILDPFAGTGTTPLTVMQMNRMAFFCELNPVLQFLIETKLSVYHLAPGERSQLAIEVRSFVENWMECLASALIDEKLDLNYHAAFGKSVFFDAETYSEVLKARSIVNQVAKTNTRLAAIVEIAVMASLVASSRLIRSGDIKYRKSKSDWKKQVVFRKEVARRLLFMAQDIEVLADYTSTKMPQFVCANAKDLSQHEANGLDGVITSPPYLNGTNYFRNTKMELWFLDHLRSKADLSQLRYDAVTAGINNVTRKKDADYVPLPVRDVVRHLESVAYDSRIPRMVSGYFYDMQLIFEAIRSKLVVGARIAIDIGDSIYANTHVKTDEYLVKLLEQMGFRSIDNVNLRKRVSRNRMEVSQVLIIMEYTGE